MAKKKQIKKSEQKEKMVSVPVLKENKEGQWHETTEKITRKEYDKRNEEQIRIAKHERRMNNLIVRRFKVMRKKPFFGNDTQEIELVNRSVGEIKEILVRL